MVHTQCYTCDVMLTVLSTFTGQVIWSQIKGECAGITLGSKELVLAAHIIQKRKKGVTINIPKIRKPFRRFNSYLSKFRSNFVLLRSRLAKIRAVLQNWKRSPPPFLGKNGRRWLFLRNGIVHYSWVSCIQGGVESILESLSCASQRRRIFTTGRQG